MKYEYPDGVFHNQFVVTKFSVPVASGSLIFRPRLSALLDHSLKYPITLVSAPAGFGKTTLLATWAQSLPASNPRLCWVSLDEEDNEPRLFWTAILTALARQQPESFTPLLEYAQQLQGPSIKHILTVLINLLMENTDRFILILDDYHLITEQQLNANLSYLVEHLPHQLHIILATRSDPPLPLSQLRVHHQLLEIRTDQLRCTEEETRGFFKEVMSIQLLDETIQEIAVRTEGWLVSLQLLRLSLPEQVNPAALLREISGDQRYILDYLTEVVLRCQPQEIQTFLLFTCILERLTASLCDAVMQQGSSQQVLERLEQANLFIVSLDSKRQWYRYHALFAEALRSQLEQTHADLVPVLHYRASLWYAAHDQTTQAILHALYAKQWHWATDLIEQKECQLPAFVWGVSKYELVLFQEWLELLPEDIVNARPLLCLFRAQLLWAIAPSSRLEDWLNTAEAVLSTLLSRQMGEECSPTLLALQEQQKQENQLGAVIAFRACMQSFCKEDGQAVLTLCQRALALLSPEDYIGHFHVSIAQSTSSYLTSINDVQASIQSIFQEYHLIAKEAELPTLAIFAAGFTAIAMIGAGQLHEIQRLTQHAIYLGQISGEHMLPDVGWPMVFQAEVLREWNRLDTALSLAQEAVSLCEQTSSKGNIPYTLCAYAILLRICLSRREFDTAHCALQQFERIGANASQYLYFYLSSLFTTVDQVRFWLACGERDRAVGWAEELDLRERYGMPFGREREDVACARIFLAKDQPTLALERLEPTLQRATAGQRWGHVIEIRLLQALAYQMHQEERQALSALLEAVRLAEPEGYIRSFVDEGIPMAALLSRLRQEQGQHRPTLYLDTLLAAFPQHKNTGHEDVLQRAGAHITIQPLRDPLSKRELEVLQLLAHGASNLEIAQELVIAIDTVKRHVSHIFAKLGVQNRIQAVIQTRVLDLLGDNKAKLKKLNNLFE